MVKPELLGIEALKLQNDYLLRQVYKRSQDLDEDDPNVFADVAAFLAEQGESDD